MAGDSSDITWNVDLEVNLFHAMRGHKPAGVNRHFQMISIHDRLSSACKKISSDDVWSHLATMYDLQALNESEIVPFPNKNGDFDIPNSDLTELVEKSFPRTPYINTPTETTTIKTDAPSKSASKSSKHESKSSSQTPKADLKTESRSSSSKSENRSSTTSSRGESKTSHNSSKSGQGSIGSNTPEPSPKRTKRTRNVPSANASPATPTEPPTKRRR